MTEQGSWVYAVAGELDADLPGDLTGVAGEAVHSISAYGLTAVTGSVPLETFGEEALRRNLEDLDWLATVARAHDAVVATVARAGPAVPFRLATVYFDDDRVRALLRNQADQFRHALANITGRAEWGVKAMLNISRLRTHAAPGTSDPPASGAGAEYLRRKREQHVTRERIDQLAVQQAGEIHQSLAELAVDARRHRLHAPTLAAHDLPMILNAAYLVDNEAADEFARAVQDQTERRQDVELELTGPWPAYSFVAVVPVGGAP